MLTGSKRVVATVALAVCLLVTGCSKSVNGTYTSTGGLMGGMITIEFKSGGKAYITSIMGPTVEASYTMDGDKILIESTKDRPKIVLTLEKDGTISGFPGGTKLEKVKK